MDISDVRIKLVSDSTDRLKAFCSVTLDGEFVIRDIKIVEGSNGLFVAMPSRKLSAPCPKCRHKNPLRARYCSECGAGLPTQEVETDDAGRAKLYRDIAHPITPAFREKLQNRLVEAYEAEIEHASDSDYGSAVEYDTDDLDDLDHAPRGGDYDDIIADLRSPVGSGRPGPRDRGQRQPRSSSEQPSGDRPRKRRRRGGRGRRTRSGEETARPRPEPSVATGAVAEKNEDRIEAVDDTEPASEVSEQLEVPSPEVFRKPPADEVSLGEAAEAPTPSPDASEDSTPFGAGIS